MEARTKTGKIIRGRIAEILVKKGTAALVEEGENPKKVAPKKAKKTTKKAKK
jgi:hypothetical protein